MMAWEAIALPLGDARVCLSILTQLAQRGECGRNSFRTSRKATRTTVGREGRGAKASRHLLTTYAIPARRGTPDLQEGNCKTRASHLQAPFATLSVHEGPHRKVNHMVARAPRQNAEVTKANEPTRHGLANRPGRCQLRGGDPVRGGVPLAAGHAGLLGGDRRAL